MKIPSNGVAVMLKKSLQLKCDLFIMTTLPFDMVLQYYYYKGMLFYPTALHCAESST